MAAGVDQLTDRERDVLRLLLAGHTAKSAAAELDLSVHTINDYLREARKKLGVSSSREAARILGELEASPPQNRPHAAPENLAPQQMGMGAAPIAADTPMPSATPAGRRALPWIIGGIVMLTAAIAAALFVASTGGSDTGQMQAEQQQLENTVGENAVAEEAARDWLALIDAGKYSQSWAEAGPMFKSVVTADSWTAQAEPVRAPLGKVLDRELGSVKSSTTLPGMPEGNYRMIVFNTDFATAGKASETVVMNKEHGQWGVIGYFIR